ncbi:HAUS augmin-like complex subunit 2 [Mytilus edulis]|uniref:HAUS augmin-like complex subunit 2 n=1 Tax=Mytilus edulis TaxID=6550 RepID=UPI0039F08F00
MDTSSSFRSFSSENPWSATGSTLAPLTNALKIAENTGHIRKRIGFDVHQLQDDYHHKLPSLKLISQLKSLSKMRKEHYKINLEVQARMQDKETSDLTHLKVLGEKIDKVQSLNSHMQSIIDSKAQLLTRLQQPYVGEFIKLEAQYHRYASEFLPEIAPLLADLSTHLDNISWMKFLNLPDSKMDNMLTELGSTLASLQTTFQSLCQMRNSMTNVYSHQAID